ncbi:MAG: hypothetical protein JST55_04550 [Bacteroidetes bacterium]|nr:hypothetical protein [Bacteroidota bacterium]
MEKLPIKFKSLFWDVNFDDINWENHSVYIAVRILNLGDWDDVLWLRERMSKDEIVELCNTNPEINRKTKNYWNTRLGD